jgi:hypothetical protein
MKKITQLATVVLIGTLSVSTAFAQNPKKATVTTMSKSKTQMAPKAKTQTSLKKDVKSQLLKPWKFHEISLRTPKDGYLMHIAEQELGLLHLFIANYTFNMDGSISLDPKYIEKQGVKSAKWEITDSGKLAITYYWTPEKQKEGGYSNDFEKIEYKIDVISDKELTLNMSDMFIVNLIVKTKK